MDAIAVTENVDIEVAGVASTLTLSTFSEWNLHVQLRVFSENDLLPSSVTVWVQQERDRSSRRPGSVSTFFPSSSIWPRQRNSLFFVLPSFLLLPLPPSRPTSSGPGWPTAKLRSWSVLAEAQVVPSSLVTANKRARQPTPPVACAATGARLDPSEARSTRSRVINFDAFVFFIRPSGGQHSERGSRGDGRRARKKDSSMTRKLFEAANF
ncbi:hypothetical protein K488DRAFT_68889 [Vararia minispora EC-137]|uniref:Uncharacterized protein n=1 Tax=Vararia minispora EC-137 TaxID=1314806 RepID=A0ACB8QSG5_9AGAM|nr:hypothetical protein K488DRAFT_68889 [Vararia minispora EC-137]